MIRKVTIISLLILVALGAAGIYFYQNVGPNKKTGYVDASLKDVDKVGNQPTQDFTLPNGQKTKVMAGEIVVKITNANTVKSFGTDISPAGLPQVYVLKLKPDEDMAKKIDEVKKLPGVKWAEPNKVTKTEQTARFPNDPEFNTGDSSDPTHQSHLVEISAPEAWAIRTSGVTVAIADSGIWRGHPDLQGKIVIGEQNTTDKYIGDTYGFDFVNGTYDPGTDRYTNDANGAEDDNGHGTSVAGTAAATTNNSRGIAGVGWDVPVFPIKVSDANGNSNTLIAARGWSYAIEVGVRVINFSSGRNCPNTTDCSDALEKEAADYVIGRGGMIVASSGNSGLDRVGAPASYGPIISVGGSAPGGSVTRHSQANYGPRLDLVAPYEVLSTCNATRCGGDLYSGWAGTSNAAPAVSAAAAMALGANSGLNAANMTTLLRNTANGPASNQVGAGRLNLYRAVECAQRCR